MSDFERAREGIEKNRRQEEDRRAAERERQEQEEKEKLLKDKNRESNTYLLATITFSLLSDINKEFFAGRGTISGWKKIKTPRHIDKRRVEGADEGGLWTRIDDEEHASVQFESRLTIPDFGDIGIFLSLEDLRLHKEEKRSGFLGLSRKYVEEEVWNAISEKGLQVCVSSTTENNAIFCIHHIKGSSNGERYFIPLDIPNEEFQSRVTSSAADAVVDLHKANLTKK